tara:strand:+ start:556 stop:936 length:381 start_codon:yes stop_codon:yes gene_type:complete
MRKLSFFINVLFNGDHQKGTDHWVGQKITSVAMVPFVVLFFVFFLMNYGSDYEEVKNYFLNPIINGLTILFFIIIFLHLKQGLEVIIEDYISYSVAREIFLKANTVLCSCMGLLGILALLSIYFIG